MDNTVANPFKSRPIVKNHPAVEILGGRPDHRVIQPTPSPLAMKLAGTACAETRGYQHAGWCRVEPCSCQVAQLAQKFDEIMAGVW